MLKIGEMLQMLKMLKVFWVLPFPFLGLFFEKMLPIGEMLKI